MKAIFLIFWSLKKVFFVHQHRPQTPEKMPVFATPPMPDVSLVSSESRSAGPRAILKTQQCREIAETIMQQEREEIREKQNDSPYGRPESTATAANIPALERLARPSALDVSSEDDLKKMADGNKKEAITFWSHGLIGNKEEKSHPTHLFARRTSFTNDIKDPRLRHDE